MEIINLSDTSFKANYENDTTEMSFNNNKNTIVMNKHYHNSYVSVLTNNNTFVIEDLHTKLVAIKELKSNEILFSHFLFDSETKTLTDLLTLKISNLMKWLIPNDDTSSSFVEVFNNETKNKKINVISFENGKKIISANGTPIIETNFNELRRINFEKAKEIPESFLCYDKDLEEANFPNTLKVLESAFLENEKMKLLNIPKAKYIGDFVLYKNKVMKEIYLPSATHIGIEFLSQNVNKKIHISNKLENFNNMLLKIQNKER